ncbi:MAG: hypothetical protein HQM15_06370 [Deltaproteobacteria bacterium]|nr:hypothetical protein [Deltaproteobacteria bacterium]
MSLTDVYEWTAQKEWKKVFSLLKNKNPTGNEHICCVTTTTDSKLYLGTMSGLYQFDGKGPWEKVPVAEKSKDSPAYHVASTNNWLALQTDAGSVYRYNFNNKTWDFIPGYFGDLIKLISHQNKLFALSNKRIYRWNEEERNWEELKQMSATQLMGETAEKEKKKKFYDLISDGNHLYLLATDGIFEISQ